MVRPLLILLLSCCLGTPVQAQPDFQVRLLTAPQQAGIELGKPLWLELSTNQTTPSLDVIDLGELASQFHIDTSSPIKFDAKRGRQYWQLRLYAYTTGTQSIPPLRYAQMHSAPLPVRVTDTIDPKTRHPIKLQLQLSHAQKQLAWVREQILLRYTLTSDNPYSQFQIPHYTQAGEKAPDQVEDQHEQRGQGPEAETDHAMRCGVGIDDKELNRRRQQADPKPLADPLTP